MYGSSPTPTLMKSIPVPSPTDHEPGPSDRSEVEVRRLSKSGEENDVIDILLNISEEKNGEELDRVQIERTCLTQVLRSPSQGDQERLKEYGLKPKGNEPTVGRSRSDPLRVRTDSTKENAKVKLQREDIQRSSCRGNTCSEATLATAKLRRHFDSTPPFQVLSISQPSRVAEGRRKLKQLSCRDSTCGAQVAERVEGTSCQGDSRFWEKLPLCKLRLMLGADSKPRGITSPGLIVGPKVHYLGADSRPQDLLVGVDSKLRDTSLPRQSRENGSRQQGLPLQVHFAEVQKGVATPNAPIVTTLAEAQKGRRICPGLPLATRMISVMLGSLLNSLDWKLDGGIKSEDLNMEEKFGMILQKAQPLFAVPVQG
ncbi:hypothetical protein ACSBR2_009986 [Camellia fascicularis]